MTALQIRNLPDHVHRKLKARAAEEGQSLSEYASRVLQAEVEKLTPDELWERIQSRGQAGNATTEDVVAIIRAGREAR